MPPIIPGARRGVRPQRGTRKTNARGRKLGSKKSSANADGSSAPRRGFGLLALVAGLVTVVVSVVLRDEAEYERESARVRDRLRSKPRATSEHAACRMECRFVSAEEAERTLTEGKLDKKHSSPGARPCPKVALNMGRIRAVWADCAESTRLVTVIDTRTDHPCGPC